jgi:hypothetical protein
VSVFLYKIDNYYAFVVAFGAAAIISSLAALSN